MGSFISQSIEQQQTIANTALNAVSSTCSATCTQIQSGNTVIIQGSTVGGITFDQQCTVNLQCTINNNLNTQLTNLLEAMSNQKSVTARGFPDITLEGVSQSSDANQVITNSLTNYVNTACTAASVQNQNNNYVYVSNSNVQGQIQFNQSADVVSNCSLSTISSLVASNQASASSSQSATILGTTGILIAIIIVVIILFIGIFLLTRLGGKKGGGEGVSSEEIAQGVSQGIAQGNIPPPV